MSNLPEAKKRLFEELDKDCKALTKEDLDKEGSYDSDISDEETD